MKTQDNAQRTFYRSRADTGIHAFSVGQEVRLRSGHTVLTSRFGDVYRVTGTLPQSGNWPQYRIRSEHEPHERVVTEDILEVVRQDALGKGETLAERTFGH
ncbi:hypothetical protein [Segnochrobactrum spirostomi]|uniref:Uncharacterized protein n=1 Tax=Segnochrobactrum spirostomi TaxID=2608987 RepID=A0A6A7Y7Q3_9HYPH|nr:hypothetical protein [Segnochrobactrum spirostomi]MQT14866.1 hypothetical protein [Segnochrobactrum spirostomi]